MNCYNFVHLALHALGGEVHGKTRLQKSIYFLGLLTGSLSKLGYRPHYYGPYSDSVSAALDSLISVGFVNRNSQHYGLLNNQGFEVVRHDFSLTDEGRTIAEKKKNESQEAWEKISTAVDRFEKARKSVGELDYMRLSIAAKTFYLLTSREDPATPTELSAAARKLGWDPSPETIEASSEFLKLLGLVADAQKAPNQGQRSLAKDAQ